MAHKEFSKMSVSFTWLGHSGFSFNINDRMIVIDPFLTHNPLAPISAEQLNPSVILVTHGHGNHIGDTVAIAKRTGALVVSTPEVCKYVQRNGVDNTWDGNIGGTFHGEFFSAKWVQAFHTSGLPDGSYGGASTGFVITANGKRLYHAGDTGLFSDMRLIGEMRLDVAFLPIGDRWTMGIEDSIAAVKLLNPRYVVPMHFDTFPPIAQDVVTWAHMVNNQTNATPLVIDPGNTYTLE
jgi:L-ascorbate metabolism protein UlaG (beta-lactamase superfamily)